MGFHPRRYLLPINRYLALDLTPSTGSICPQGCHLQWNLSNVCAMKSVHLPSYLSCLVSSSSPVIYSYTIVQVVHLYSHMFTQVRSIHSYIHAYKANMQLHSYMIALTTQSLVWSYPFSSVLTHHYVKQQVLTNEELVIIIKSVIPSVFGQEMSLINHFKWPIPTNEQLVVLIFIE